VPASVNWPLKNLENDWVLENRTINLRVVAEVAEALKHLNDKVVFVGGAVVSLYANDAAADEIRPTGDIDLTIVLMTYLEWVQVQEELAVLNIHPDPYGPSMCRYRLRDIPIDIMPFQNSAIGPSNRWYAMGMDSLQTLTVHDQQLRILSAPCFLATKFEAFHGRGSDYRTSHDMEDIVYVLDNRTTIVDEIANASPEIREFLQESINSITRLGLLDEVLTAHIHPIMLEERLPIVHEKIRDILA